ncbi:LysR family transcriptional regulator [Peristeroidobacter agariperforans]|uniref:LysR family transcriptional regulator n=1 Tax=Peristeroidobacter agariperforans TaxID=268404 RepID=UPI0018E55E34|nr:LysR family transcriptional regulator [Peristeroidobacter agariperforans]
MTSLPSLSRRACLWITASEGHACIPQQDIRRTGLSTLRRNPGRFEPKSLQALEATARHGSFVGAASELDVAAAAVGQLVRSLEKLGRLPALQAHARAPSGSRRRRMDLNSVAQTSRDVVGGR